ncbi:type IV toxin-antitoxin system AbiEi family antitoxin domain-containing protein [Phytoactinopolyspora limicola]|uniref:type IV toxin-antitoxin system AbiEi family antitoxin domain-containing protein n=1 Tax=Phytoactinopolyspora limicola TaxID=2715536 RepID=UPI001407C024|nr:type IV toxin-antitoxin system AbiEi family antitoxin domain-containing protein [Phytoactinopolyspora limicola]
MAVPPELLRLAELQDGLVVRHQALAAGMSSAAVEHALTSGRWQRVSRGVYATFTGPLQPRHRLRTALLRAGPDAVVSGADACRAYGLRYVPEGADPLVLVPAESRRARTPFARLRRVTDLPEARLVGGIPTASPERAVLDTCHGVSSLRDVRALLCEVVQRGLTTPNRLARTLRAARWPGARLVRQALADVDAGCRSAPECELRDVIGCSTFLPEPQWNTIVPDVTPPLRPDACWPDARVVVEIDSAEWHRLGEQVEQTERRRARYAALGWTVLPVSPRRLRTEPRVVLDEIEAAVRSGLARHAA